MNCVKEALASVWIQIFHAVNRKALEADLVTVAKEQLRDAITAMHEQIEKHDRELSSISTTVRNNRATLGKDRLNTLLLKSRRTRASIATIHGKLTLMEGQLDAMESNEVNKTILSTLQTSVKAMKKMGLSNDLRKTDDVISEMERNMECAHDINSTVNSSIVQFDSSADDDTLEEELNMLLGITDNSEAVAGGRGATGRSTTGGVMVGTPETTNSIPGLSAALPAAADATQEPQRPDDVNNRDDQGPAPPPAPCEAVRPVAKSGKKHDKTHSKQETIREEETDSEQEREEEAMPV